MSPTPPANVAAAHQLLQELLASSGHQEDPTDPSTVQAMQIVLRVPKADPPPRSALLAAAGSAVAQVCLNPEIHADPELRARLARWYGHRIRKVARRGRNKAWMDVQSLAGASAEVGEAAARAFVPSAVSEVPQALARLQIAGTDLPVDQPAAAPSASDPVVLVDASLGMTAGKAAAQVGHATMLLAAEQSADWATAWYERGCPLAVREVDTATFIFFAGAPEAVLVRDAGFTEVAPGSVTVLALPEGIYR